MDSIKDGIDATTISVRIRLERQQYKGSYLLVEGDSDAKLFTKYCDSVACTIVVCFGRETLFEVLAQLYEEDYCGILGLVDRDYTDMLPGSAIPGDAVYTGENDVEIMMLCSGAFDRVTQEYGRLEKIRAAETSASMSGRDLIFRSASVVGALRFLAQKKGWPLCFENMTYKFTRTNTYLLDETATVGHVLGRSNTAVDMTKDEIIEFVRNRASHQVPEKNLCNGHDSVRVLGRALKTSFGNNGQFNNEAGGALLESALRLAYEFQHFSQTKTYSDIRSWEERTNYNVLIATGEV